MGGESSGSLIAFSDAQVGRWGRVTERVEFVHLGLDVVKVVVGRSWLF